MRSGFGRRKHPQFDTYTVQNGIEIDAPEDAPVLAVYEGTVVFADHFKGYGLMVVARPRRQAPHPLRAPRARPRSQWGRRWRRATSWAPRAQGGEGPGLYFEVRFQGRPEDPLDWLKKAER